MIGAIGGAQSPRPLSLVAGPRIEARQMMSARDIIVAAGPDGRIVVAGRAANGEIRGYDSAGTMSPWKLAVGRADSAEIMYPSRVGWVDGTTTMWINDPGYRQIVLVDGRGRISKSIEYPSWLHPHWADRRAYPVFAAMEPMAVYADSSMLVLPLRERSLIDTPGYDHSVQHLLRVSRNGAIERAVATLPLEQGRVVARGPGAGERIINIPFAAKTIFATSSDGRQLVFLVAGRHGRRQRHVSRHGAQRSGRHRVQPPLCTAGRAAAARDRRQVPRQHPRLWKLVGRTVARRGGGADPGVSIVRDRDPGGARSFDVGVHAPRPGHGARADRARARRARRHRWHRCDPDR